MNYTVLCHHWRRSYVRDPLIEVLTPCFCRCRTHSRQVWANAMSKKSQVWEHFFRSSENAGQNNTHKAAWCNYCTNTEVQTILKEDTDRVRNGELTKVRELAALQAEGKLEFTGYICSSNDSEMPLARKRIRYITGKTSTLWNHLKNDCKSCPKHVRRLAKIARGESINKSDEDGGESSSELVPESFNKRAKTSKALQTTFQVLKVPSVPFTSNRQHEFESDLVRMFATANFPISSIEEEEVRKFFSKWIPGASIPWAKRFGGSILSKEVGRLGNELKSRVKGRLATVQCDGWKDVSRKHLIPFMFTADRTVSQIIYLFVSYPNFIIGSSYSCI